MIPVWIVIPLAIVLYGLLFWLRRGHGGKLGRKIRASDHAAWRDAMNRKERELELLRQVEPQK